MVGVGIRWWVLVCVYRFVGVYRILGGLRWDYLVFVCVCVSVNLCACLSLFTSVCVGGCIVSDCFK